MDMEAINRINALVREEKSLNDTLTKMTKQCESIRKYCLDALDDCGKTIEEVAKVIRNNLPLFTCGHHGTIFDTYLVDGGNGHTFKIDLYHDNGDFTIDNVNMTDGTGKTLTIGYYGYGTLTNHAWVRFSGLNALRKELTEAEDTLVKWTERQECAEVTRLWTKTVLTALEGHLSRIVSKRRNELANGIHAASKEYEEIT